MSVKKRVIGLNDKDINDAIKTLKNIKKGVANVTPKIESILDEAVEYCRKASGNYKGEVFWEKTEKGYRVVQKGKGAAYVEFGTGVIGENFPHHPLHEQFGMEEHNSRREHKFNYNYGMDAWVYPKSEGGFGITSGQPAHMQMYKTALFLRERLSEEIKMTVGKEVHKW